MERTLSSLGFDRFMSMYRIDDATAAAAWSALGALYLKDGRPLATIYLASAANAKLTRLIQDIRLDEPGYEFESLAGLVDRILASGERAGYASSSGLWEDLVLLGRALSKDGSRDSAKEIWAVAAKAPRPWGTMASQELAGLLSGPGRR
jgi:hypothetical protein